MMASKGGEDRYEQEPLRLSQTTYGKQTPALSVGRAQTARQHAAAAART